MSELRYGFYLRPSFEMCQTQVAIHHLLERQYGLRVAGRFMPHATIKGFFRSDAAVAQMVERLDLALQGRARFPVYNNGLAAFGRAGIALRIGKLNVGELNPWLQALHEAALDALQPLVHPECNFTPREWSGPRFDAHLTLAMADLPERFFDEVFAFLQQAEPIGPREFPAEILQLFAFQSDNWYGQWWEGLRWELLHSWKLPAP